MKNKVSSVREASLSSVKFCGSTDSNTFSWVLESGSTSDAMISGHGVSKFTESFPFSKKSSPNMFTSVPMVNLTWSGYSILIVLNKPFKPNFSISGIWSSSTTFSLFSRVDGVIPSTALARFIPLLVANGVLSLDVDASPGGKIYLQLQLMEHQAPEGEMSRRLLPNIIITGTPGCGKTSHSQRLCEEFPKLRHFQIGEVAKRLNCFDGFDEARDTNIVDDDKLLDEIEPDLEKGGVVVDWHVCDIFPERLIDLVVVLQCDNGVLYDRLSKRGYKQSKIEENLDAEIMQVILQEARDSYAPELLVELHSEEAEMMEQNVERLAAWLTQWLEDHPKGVSNELQASSSEEEDEDDE